MILFLAIDPRPKSQAQDACRPTRTPHASPRSQTIHPGPSGACDDRDQHKLQCFLNKVVGLGGHSPYFLRISFYFIQRFPLSRRPGLLSQHKAQLVIGRISLPVSPSSSLTVFQLKDRRCSRAPPTPAPCPPQQVAQPSCASECHCPSPDCELGPRAPAGRPC